MSKYLLVSLVLLGACERTRAPTSPAVAPPADAAIEDAVDDADVDVAPVAFEETCEDAGSSPMKLAGVAGTITVQECKTGQDWDNEEARDQGFVWDEMEGRIVWEPDGAGDPHVWIFDNWHDGWESGWSPVLVGVLEAPSGASAVLIGGLGHSPAAGWKGQAQQIDAYRIVAGELEKTNRFDGTAMKATIATNRKSARVEWCQPAEDPDQPKGCMDVEDADPMPPFTMRFDGAKVVWAYDERRK